jgi:hypothetical protein
VRFNRNGGVPPPRRPKIRKILPQIWQVNEALQELDAVVEAIDRINQKLGPGLGSHWTVKAVRCAEATRRFRATTVRHFQEEQRRQKASVVTAATASKTVYARAEHIRAPVVGAEINNGPLVEVENFGSADALSQVDDLEK